MIAKLNKFSQGIRFASNQVRCYCMSYEVLDGSMPKYINIFFFAEMGDIISNTKKVGNYYTNE